MELGFYALRSPDIGGSRSELIMASALPSMLSSCVHPALNVATDWADVAAAVH